MGATLDRARTGPLAQSAGVQRTVDERCALCCVGSSECVASDGCRGAPGRCALDDYAVDDKAAVEPLDACGNTEWSADPYP